MVEKPIEDEGPTRSAPSQITRELVAKFARQGLSDAEIGHMLGITRAGVKWHRDQMGLTNTVTRVKGRLPWEVTGDAVNAAPYRAILNHLEFQETRGVNMRGEKLRKLKGFYEKLDAFSVVVRYDPSIPPRPGQKYGHSEYVPRTLDDDNLIIRLDERTTISADDRHLWQLPARGDWPK